MSHLTACPKCWDDSPLKPDETRHVGVLTVDEDGKVYCDKCGAAPSKVEPV